MKYQVRELGIGGILDQAIALLKNRFGLLLSITLVLLVPFQIVTGLVLLGLMPVMPPQPTVADIAAFQQKFLMAALPFSFAVSFLFFVFVLPLTNAAITFAVANAYLERPISLGSSLRRTLQIALPFVGTGILYGLAVSGGMFLCLIPGILFSL